MENPWDRVECLSLKEGYWVAYTVLRGSVRTPSGFSWGKPTAAQPWGLRPLSFAALGWTLENPSRALTLPLSSVGTLDTLLREKFVHTAPRIFNSLF